MKKNRLELKTINMTYGGMKGPLVKSHTSGEYISVDPPQITQLRAEECIFFCSPLKTIRK